MTADRFSEEVVEASRKRLGLPDDYEWYSCAAECGDIVWVPPGTGDQPIAPVCSAGCLAMYLAAVEKAHGS